MSLGYSVDDAHTGLYLFSPGPYLALARHQVKNKQLIKCLISCVCVVWFLNDKGPKLFISLLGKFSFVFFVLIPVDQLTPLVFSLASVALIIMVVSLTIMHAEYVKWSKIPITRLPTVPTISSPVFDDNAAKVRSNAELTAF